MDKRIGPYDEVFDFRRDHRRFVRFSTYGCQLQIQQIEISEKGDQVPLGEKYICSVKDLPDLINGLQALNNLLARKEEIKTRIDISYEECGPRILRVSTLYHMSLPHILLEDYSASRASIRCPDVHICFRAEILSRFISALHEVKEKELVDIYEEGVVQPIRISTFKFESAKFGMQVYTDIQDCYMTKDRMIGDRPDPESLRPSSLRIRLKAEALSQLIEALKQIQEKINRVEEKDKTQKQAGESDAEPEGRIG